VRFLPKVESVVILSAIAQEKEYADESDEEDGHQDQKPPLGHEFRHKHFPFVHRDKYPE